MKKNQIHRKNTARKSAKTNMVRKIVNRQYIGINNSQGEKEGKEVNRRAKRNERHRIKAKQERYV